MMNRTSVRHVLEATTNVCLIALCVLIAVILMRTKGSSTIASRSESALRQGGLLAGTKDLKLGSRETLVLALSASCSICRASVPFYKHLAEVRPRNSNFKMVAIFQDSEDEAAKFTNGISPESLVTLAGQDFRKFGISQTPTLLLIDANSRVEKVWVGRLSPSQQVEVIEIVGQAGT